LRPISGGIFLLFDINKSIEIAKKGDSIDYSTYVNVLEQLETYECWDYWFDLVCRHASSNPANFAEDQCRIAKTNLRYFEDVRSASESCRVIVESTGMTFFQFRTDVLDRIIDHEEFAIEGVILREVWERFSTIDDRVEALERICFIYEKKTHNEFLLNQFYERLLKTHPLNSKALKYFRTLYSQQQEWTLVIEVLEKLFSASKHPQESFRYAQEMAAVYLYQLDSPQEAVKTIENRCKNSTLDTSTIHYEAYLRLGNIEGCLRVLRASLLSVEEDITRSIIHYRIASLYEQQANYSLAYDNFEKAFSLNESFLEAIEGLISTCLKTKNWIKASEFLHLLAAKVGSPVLANQVRAGLARLDEGLNHANFS
jgi:tetratricopeptide (TPR) repeat protein